MAVDGLGQDWWHCEVVRLMVVGVVGAMDFVMGCVMTLVTVETALLW